MVGNLSPNQERFGPPEKSDDAEKLCRLECHPKAATSALKSELEDEDEFEDD